MDLKTRGVPPTDIERAAIDSVLGVRTLSGHHDRRGGGSLRARRHLLLPTLHAVNDRIGWISPAAIDDIAERLDVSPAEIHGVVTFYALFSTDPRTGRQVHVCIDLACRMTGPVDADARASGMHQSPCLGMCEQAPAALVIDPGEPAQRTSLGSLGRGTLVGLATADVHPQAVAATTASVPQAGSDDLVLLRRVGRGAPLDVDGFIADGGFRALEFARQIGPDRVIEAVDTAGLLGRGGAAFPTARKWRAVRDQVGRPHHLICNADESEPGTFKDRVLLEHDPFTVLESMAIAALAIGSDHGWIYLRGEYPTAESTLHSAIDILRSRGVLGGDTGFDVTVARGAGAYICGEETAIFNSIEGYRGEPRNKPPFPFESGLFGEPTVVNNVETLVNVPPILLGRSAPNRRLFCLSGAVTRPGVYEAELGLTLAHLIDLAGGMQAGSELRAVLLGGAAGRFVGPDALELVLDHESTRTAGLSLGSGVVMVHDQHVDLVEQARRIALFFRDESCGQCVPCRIGTMRQLETVEHLAAGRLAARLDLLADIGRAMTDASICGLGQTAHHAIESLVSLDVFPRERPA